MDDVGEAQTGEGLGHELDAAAVQGSIDNLEVVLVRDGLRIQRQRFDACQIYIVHLAADDADAVVAAVPQNLVVGGHSVHLVDDALVVRRHNLSTVAPIHLVAVVLLGVVRGGHHHAGVAAKVAHGEGELWRGAQVLKEVAEDTVGGHHAGGHLSEEAAVVARVVRYHHLQLLVREIFLQIVGKPLGGCAHRVTVHAVGAYAHDAAQTARAKLQRTVETLVELVRILVDESLHLIARLFIEIV